MPMRPPMLETLTIVPESRSSIRGSNARLMWTGDVKLTRITWSTSSVVSRWTGVRFGIAALLTSTSRWPNASHASSATATAASMSPRSVAQSRESGVCSWHSASTASSRSRRRATIPTVAPRSASIGASAAPMPDEAPVTRIFEPSIFIWQSSFGNLHLAIRMTETLFGAPGGGSPLHHPRRARSAPGYPAPPSGTLAAQSNERSRSRVRARSGLLCDANSTATRSVAPVLARRSSPASY